MPLNGQIPADIHTKEHTQRIRNSTASFIRTDDCSPLIFIFKFRCKNDSNFSLEIQVSGCVMFTPCVENGRRQLRLP